MSVTGGRDGGVGTDAAGAAGAGGDDVRADSAGGDSVGAGSTAVRADARPALGRGFRFQWEPAQKAHVLLYPEGMVKLNGSAGEILKRCDGVRTVAEIVADLESTFATTGLEKDVHTFMTMAVTKRWLEMRQ